MDPGGNPAVVDQVAVRLTLNTQDFDRNFRSTIKTVGEMAAVATATVASLAVLNKALAAPTATLAMLRAAAGAVGSDLKGLATVATASFTALRRGEGAAAAATTALSGLKGVTLAVTADVGAFTAAWRQLPSLWGTTREAAASVGARFQALSTVAKGLGIEVGGTAKSLGLIGVAATAAVASTVALVRGWSAGTLSIRGLATAAGATVLSFAVLNKALADPAGTLRVLGLAASAVMTGLRGLGAAAVAAFEALRAGAGISSAAKTALGTLGETARTAGAATSVFATEWRGLPGVLGGVSAESGKAGFSLAGLAANTKLAGVASKELYLILATFVLSSVARLANTITTKLAPDMAGLATNFGRTSTAMLDFQGKIVQIATAIQAGQNRAFGPFRDFLLGLVPAIGPGTSALIAATAQVGAYGSVVFSAAGFLATWISRLTILAGVLGTFKLALAIPFVSKFVEGLQSASAVAGVEITILRALASVLKGSVTAGAASALEAVIDLTRGLKALVAVQFTAALSAITNYIAGLKAASALTGASIGTTAALGTALGIKLAAGFDAAAGAAFALAQTPVAPWLALITLGIAAYIKQADTFHGQLVAHRQAMAALAAPTGDVRDEIDALTKHLEEFSPAEQQAIQDTKQLADAIFGQVAAQKQLRAAQLGRVGTVVDIAASERQRVTDEQIEQINQRIVARTREGNDAEVRRLELIKAALENLTKEDKASKDLEVSQRTLNDLLVIEQGKQDAIHAAVASTVTIMQGRVDAERQVLDILTQQSSAYGKIAELRKRLADREDRTHAVALADAVTAANQKLVAARERLADIDAKMLTAKDAEYDVLSRTVRGPARRLVEQAQSALNTARAANEEYKKHREFLLAADRAQTDFNRKQSEFNALSQEMQGNIEKRVAAVTTERNELEKANVLLQRRLDVEGPTLTNQKEGIDLQNRKNDLDKKDIEILADRQRLAIATNEEEARNLEAQRKAIQGILDQQGKARDPALVRMLDEISPREHQIREELQGQYAALTAILSGKKTLINLTQDQAHKEPIVTAQLRDQLAIIQAQGTTEQRHFDNQAGLIEAQRTIVGAQDESVARDRTLIKLELDLLVSKQRANEAAAESLRLQLAKLKAIRAEAQATFEEATPEQGPKAARDLAAADEQVKAMEASLEATNVAAQQNVASAIALGKAYENVGKTVKNLGDIFSGTFQTIAQALTGAKVTGEDVAHAIVTDITGAFQQAFANALASKLNFDLKFKTNFLEDLPRIAGAGISAIGGLFSSLFGSVSGQAAATANPAQSGSAASSLLGLGQQALSTGQTLSSVSGFFGGPTTSSLGSSFGFGGAGAAGVGGLAPGAIGTLGGVPLVAGTIGGVSAGVPITSFGSAAGLGSFFAGSAGALAGPGAAGLSIVSGGIPAAEAALTGATIGLEGAAGAGAAVTAPASEVGAAAGAGAGVAGGAATAGILLGLTLVLGNLNNILQLNKQKTFLNIDQFDKALSSSSKSLNAIGYLTPGSMFTGSSFTGEINNAYKLTHGQGSALGVVQSVFDLLPLLLSLLINIPSQGTALRQQQRRVFMDEKAGIPFFGPGTPPYDRAFGQTEIRAGMANFPDLSPDQQFQASAQADVASQESMIADLTGRQADQIKAFEVALLSFETQGKKGLASIDEHLFGNLDNLLRNITNRGLDAADTMAAIGKAMENLGPPILVFKSLGGAFEAGTLSADNLKNTIVSLTELINTQVPLGVRPGEIALKDFNAAMESGKFNAERLFEKIKKDIADVSASAQIIAPGLEDVFAKALTPSDTQKNAFANLSGAPFETNPTLAATNLITDVQNTLLANLESATAKAFGDGIIQAGADATVLQPFIATMNKTIADLADKKITTAEATTIIGGALSQAKEALATLAPFMRELIQAGRDLSSTFATTDNTVLGLATQIARLNEATLTFNRSIDQSIFQSTHRGLSSPSVIARSEPLILGELTKTIQENFPTMLPVGAAPTSLADLTAMMGKPTGETPAVGGITGQPITFAQQFASLAEIQTLAQNYATTQIEAIKAEAAVHDLVHQRRIEKLQDEAHLIDEVENKAILVRQRDIERIGDQLNILQKQNTIAQSWKSILDQTKSTLESIQLGSGSPLLPGEQFALIQAKFDKQIALFNAAAEIQTKGFPTGEGPIAEQQRADAVAQLNQLGPALLGAGQAAGMLPSSDAFRALYDRVTGALNRIVGTATTKTADLPALTQQIVDLQTQATADQEAIRKLQADANVRLDVINQSILDNNDAIRRTDRRAERQIDEVNEQLGAYLRWIKGEGNALLEARHMELTTKLGAMSATEVNLADIAALSLTELQTIVGLLRGQGSTVTPPPPPPTGATGATGPGMFGLTPASQAGIQVNLAGLKTTGETFKGLSELGFLDAAGLATLKSIQKPDPHQAFLQRLVAAVQTNFPEALSNAEVFNEVVGALAAKIANPGLVQQILGFKTGGVAEKKTLAWVAEQQPEVIAPIADLPRIFLEAMRRLLAAEGGTTRAGALEAYRPLRPEPLIMMPPPARSGGVGNILVEMHNAITIPIEVNGRINLDDVQTLAARLQPQMEAAANRGIVSDRVVAELARKLRGAIASTPRSL